MPCSTSTSPNPAETYEQYFGPTIADPWTRVLLAVRGAAAWRTCAGCGVWHGQCGTARRTHGWSAGKVVALDISPAMLAVARALPAPAGATIAWREGNAISLDLPDDTFDLVLCQQGLQFFPDRAAALREMRRVLTDGGRVVLSVWQALQHHPVYAALFEATARSLGVPISTVDVSFSLWDAEELRTLLSDAGFQRIAMTPRSLTIHLPAPERFVQLTVLGAATSIPSVCASGCCGTLRTRGGGHP